MKVSTALKLGLTALLFLILFTRVRPSEIFNTFESLNIPYLIPALLTVLVLFLTRTYKWGILLRSTGITKRFSELFKVLIIGVFYGAITPGKVGELGRAYHLKENRTTVLSTVLVEKITDVLALVVLGAVTIALFFNNQSTMPYLIAVCVIVVLCCTATLVSRRCLLLVARFFKIGAEHVDTFVTNCRNQLTNPKILPVVILSTFGYYGIAYLLGYFLLLALNADVSAVIALPLIVLMGNIPVTISGLGLRESVGSYCFLQLGETAANGFAFSLLLFLTMVLIPGLFGYLFALRGTYTEQNNSTPDDCKSKGQITGLLSPFLEERRLQKVLPHIHGERVLDYGCGYGKLASILNGKEYLGVDINEDVLLTARLRYQNNARVSFHSPSSLNDSDRIFDTIILSAVLEHLDDPIGQLKFFRERLSTDGRIIITTPTEFANTILSAGSHLRLFSKEAVEEHDRLYNKQDFVRFSNETGLKLVHYERFEFGLNQVVVYTK